MELSAITCEDFLKLFFSTDFFPKIVLAAFVRASDPGGSTCVVISQWMSRV